MCTSAARPAPVNNCKLQVQSLQQRSCLCTISQASPTLLHHGHKPSLTYRSVTAATDLLEQLQPAQPKMAQIIQSGFQKERCSLRKQPSKPALIAQSLSMVSCQLARSAIPDTMQAAWMTRCQVIVRYVL